MRWVDHEATQHADEHGGIHAVNEHSDDNAHHADADNCFEDGRVHRQPALWRRRLLLKWNVLPVRRVRPRDRVLPPEM